MKLIPCQSTQPVLFGLFLSLDVCCSCAGLRGKGAPGQAGGLRFGGRRVVRRLPSGARSRGPSPNSLRLLRSATFKQAATSQSTKRAARAGHEPCAPQRRRGALRPARARLCGNVDGVRRKSQHGAARADSCFSSQTRNGGSAAGGTRQGRFLGRRAAQGLRPRAQRVRELTCRRMSERRERSERSEFGDGPQDRAAQCSRRTRRPPQHEPLPGTACRAAQTPRESSRPRTAATRRKRPTEPAFRFVRRRTYQVRCSN